MGRNIIRRIVHGANVLGQVVHGTSCPWGRLTMGQVVHGVSCQVVSPDSRRKISRQSSRIRAQDYQRLLEKLFNNPTVKNIEDLRKKGIMDVFIAWPKKHSSESIWPMARDKEVTSAVHHEFSSHSFDDSTLSYLLSSWKSLCCAVFTEDTALHAPTLYQTFRSKFPTISKSIRELADAT